MSNNKTMFFLLFLLLVTAGCGGAKIDRQKAGAIVNDAASDVAQVTQVSEGQNGAPIIILEENHASRAVRLEEAIVLSRLLDNHKINLIGLEGSIKEKPQIDGQWFIKAAKDQPETLVPVTVNLLSEGEINSAEFMELVYENFDVFPIETLKEYEVGQFGESSDASMIYISYLYRFAMNSMRPEHEAKLFEFENKMKKLKGNTAAQKQVEQDVLKYIYNLKPSELSNDPWVKETSDKLLGSGSDFSLEKEISFYEDLQRRIEAKYGKPEIEEQRSMEGFVNYLKARLAANKTMVEAIGKIADKNNIPAVAMIIGAAHTEGICKLLKEADRPFAVIKPNSLNLKEDSTSLTSAMYKNKLAGSSVYSGEVTETLLAAFPVNSSRLPQPVIQQKWFNAKAELYLFTERITRKTLAAGGDDGAKPPIGGEPPIFGDNDFNGNGVFINPKTIQLVRDGNESEAMAVLFAAELNRNDPSRHKTIWVKAGRSAEAVPPAGEKNKVEKFLKEALFEIKKEKLKDGESSRENKKPKDKKNAPDNLPKETELPPVLENKAGGRIKITKETTAAFGNSKEAVMKKSVITKL